MVGRPNKKVFCEAKRKYDGNQCQAKGILCRNGRYICRYHGGMSTGAKTLEGKLKQYRNLIQYRNKTDEEIKRYLQQDH
jgi:hypothetical protein|tara:strand:+ start:712 stop:948 length:237 start_codon:yes stop_codon:yes gene_type:complete